MSDITIENKLTEMFDNWSKESVHLDSALTQVRKNAIKSFSDLGIPKLKSEAYKYTPVQRLINKNFDFSVSNQAAGWTKDACKEEFYQDDKANHLVFINGEYVSDYSEIRSTDDLEIKTIDDESFDQNAEIKNLMGKTRSIEKDAFAALNLAFFNNGLFIKVNKNKDAIDTFVYHFVDSESGQTINFPRILIIGEQGSRANIYEKTFSKGSQNVLALSILEASVAANAEVRFTKLQQFASNEYTIDGIYANQDKDSRFYTNTYSISGAVIRNNIHINIGGENSEAHMNGLYQIAGKSHVDNNTSVDHMVPNCYSNELYKGIMDENSRGVFNGKIYVRPDAQKTNAFQSNNNIVLSDTAIVNTKPQLEIWADDVKCSHGCTTGQLDEEAIFYLRARGIDKKSAKALMLNAFANETLEEVKNEQVKEEIEGIILNKLHY